MKKPILILLTIMAFAILFTLIVIVKAATYCSPNEVCDCDVGDNCIIQDYVYNNSNQSQPVTDQKCMVYYTNLTDNNMVNKSNMSGHANGWHNHTITIAKPYDLSYVVNCNASNGYGGWSGLIRARDTERTLLNKNFTTVINNQATITGNEVIIDEKVNGISGNLSTNMTTAHRLLDGIQLGEALNFTRLQNNFSTLFLNVSQIRIRQDEIQLGEALNFSKLLLRQNEIQLGEALNFTTIYENFTTINTKLNGIASNLSNLTTNININISDIKVNLTDVLAVLGNPGTNSTTIWDYMWGSTTGSTSAEGGLLYRMWQYKWRLTNGIET